MNSLPRRTRALITAVAAIAVALAVVLALVLSRHSPPATTGVLPSASATPNAAPADVTQRIVDILTQMHQKAFNPTAPPPKNSGGLSGGLFVNWSATWDGNLATAMQNTNFQSNGKTDSELGLSIRHDEFTDLIYLRSLLGYRAAHPADHSFDADIARMTPIVKSDFQAYDYYKCSLYSELEDMARFDPNGGWAQMADRYVEAVFAHSYDSTLGTVVGNGGSTTYRVDFAIECAVAFTDAGNRLGNPAMTEAGTTVAQHLIDNAIDPVTHLLPLQLTASTSGKDTLEQQQVKMGEESQSLDAMLTMYDLTHRQAFLTQVHDAVRWLFSSSLHDPVNGGFFFAINSNGTGLDPGYDESRQAWMLPLLQHLERLEPGQWTERITEMLSVVKDKLWNAAGDGYVYRTTPSFTVYSTHEGPMREIVTESWITSEAMNIAAQSLEEYAAGV